MQFTWRMLFWSLLTWLISWWFFFQFLNQCLLFICIGLVKLWWQVFVLILFLWTWNFAFVHYTLDICSMKYALAHLSFKIFMGTFSLDIYPRTFAVGKQFGGDTACTRDDITQKESGDVGFLIFSLFKRGFRDWWFLYLSWTGLGTVQRNSRQSQG